MPLCHMALHPVVEKLAKHPHLGEIEGVQVRRFLMWDLGLSTRRGASTARVIHRVGYRCPCLG
jgi:hypothetical protein